MKLCKYAFGAGVKQSLHVAEAGIGQIYITAAPAVHAGAAPDVSDMYRSIASVLRDRSAVVVHERIFGSLSEERAVLSARELAFEQCGVSSDGPVAYIEGACPDGSGLAGVIIRGIVPQNSDDIWTVACDGIACGRGWRKQGAVFIQLQNVYDSNDVNQDNNAASAQAIIARADTILRSQGASYRDVARTWFYISDILDWYADFNRIRNEKYREFGIMPLPCEAKLLLPASTGIGANNPRKSPLTMDLLAVTGPVECRPIVRQLTNVVQLDAFLYGASFSRGAVIREPDVTIIEVSGTSAIDRHGQSVCPGDVRSQIIYTLDAIGALLEREGASMKDVAAATVFVKRAADAATFRDIAVARGLDKMPVICVVADICRDELLFEMDAQVVVNKGEKQE